MFSVSNPPPQTGLPTLLAFSQTKTDSAVYRSSGNEGHKPRAIVPALKIHTKSVDLVGGMLSVPAKGFYHSVLTWLGEYPGWLVASGSWLGAGEINPPTCLLYKCHIATEEGLGRHRGIDASPHHSYISCKLPGGTSRLAGRNKYARALAWKAQVWMPLPF